MYFCNLNRMLRVEHAQQFRSFNNTAVYYKLIMKKYNQQADERTENNDIASRLAMLTQNSTIEELFGVENVLDEMAVSSKQQHTILSKEPIRLHTYAKIDREVITNSTVDVAKNVYDLFSVNQGNIAVEYFNLDPILNKSDNIGFTSWFKINNYIPSEQYNIFDHLDNDQGWRIDIMDNIVKVTLNKFEYIFNVELEEEVWYNITLNLDQRNEEAELFIYKRNCLFEEDAPLLDSSELLLLNHFVFDITPIEYELDDFNPRILGSDMRMTNIRLYTDIIPLEHHNIILNQYIVSEDSKYLVFGDNANNRIYLPNYPLNER